MSILSVTTFVSLDGVMQSPGGAEEDTAGGFALGGWVMPHFDDRIGSGFIDPIFSRADAFLLGRSTYSIFASYWPKVTDPHDAVASRLNRLPKHVATRTLSSVDWAGSEIVRDPLAELDALKARYRGELQVHGSASLARALLAAGVVDELNLMTFPVLLGRGKRLFPGEGASAAWKLVSSEVTATGVVLARYRKSGEVPRADVPPQP